MKIDTEPQATETEAKSADVSNSKNGVVSRDHFYRKAMSIPSWRRNILCWLKWRKWRMAVAFNLVHVQWIRDGEKELALEAQKRGDAIWAEILFG